MLYMKSTNLKGKQMTMSKAIAMVLLPFAIFAVVAFTNTPSISSPASSPATTTVHTVGVVPSAVDSLWVGEGMPCPAFSVSSVADTDGRCHAG